MKTENTFEIICLVSLVTILLSWVFPEYSMFLLIIMMAIDTLLLYLARTEYPNVKPVVVSELKCDTCGAVLVRNFQYGDTVFVKVNTPCPECGKSTMKVRAIYSVYPKLRDRELIKRLQEKRSRI